MLRVAIRADLWDIEQQGCDAFIDRVRGELGFTAVTVPLLHRATTCLRVRPGATPRIFTSAGGLAFQPSDEQFRATRLHPAPADWLRGRDPIARLADAARQAGMTLTAELDAAGLAACAAKQERGVRKNAFSDAMPGRVCLSDPDARECLLGIAANVEDAYGVTDVTLRRLDHASPPGESAAPELGPVAAWLLDHCFCESCRQQMSAADIDAAACSRRVVTLLDTAFETGGAGYDAVEALLEDDALLRKFHGWSEAQTIALLRAMKNRMNADVTLVCDSAAPSTLAEHVRRAELPVRWSHPCMATTADETAGIIERLTAEVPKDCVELRFSMSPRLTPDAQTLVRFMTRAAEAGVRRLQIDDYGSVPTVRLDWMRQAIRYAVRAAG